MNREMLSTIAASMKVMDGLKAMLDALKQHEVKLYIVSGSIRSIIDDVLNKYLGDLDYYFTDIRANQLKFSSTDGSLDEIVGTEFDFWGKARYVKDKVIHKNKFHPFEVWYVGNSHNDKFVACSGARTLCINPNNVDIHTRGLWTRVESDVTDITKILEVFTF